MKNIFQCDECKSENLELIKRETKQKWDNYYMEMEYFDVLTFKCKDCGCETVECPWFAEHEDLRTTQIYVRVEQERIKQSHKKFMS